MFCDYRLGGMVTPRFLRGSHGVVIFGLLVTVALLITTGCGKNGNQIKPPVGEVDKITLLANPPVALNLDGLPGDDGLDVPFL